MTAVDLLGLACVLLAGLAVWLGLDDWQWHLEVDRQIQLRVDWIEYMTGKIEKERREREALAVENARLRRELEAATSPVGVAGSVRGLPVLRAVMGFADRLN